MKPGRAHGRGIAVIIVIVKVCRTAMASAVIAAAIAAIKRFAHIHPYMSSAADADYRFVARAKTQKAAVDHPGFMSPSSNFEKGQLMFSGRQVADPVASAGCVMNDAPVYFDQNGAMGVVVNFKAGCGSAL